MITFTQSGYSLTCSDVCIGAEYSDVEVAVNLTDGTFNDYDYVGLYVSRSGGNQVWMSEINGGFAKIPHQALSDTHDVFVSIGAFDLDNSNELPQQTTAAINLAVLHSNNPNGLNGDDTDWKDAVKDMIMDAVSIDVIDNLESKSTKDALSANQGRILKGLVEQAAQTGGTGSGEVSLSAVNSVLSTGANFVRVGNMGICMGTFTLPAFQINNAVGNMYYADALIQSNGPLQLEGNFPFCFSQKPTVTVSLSGLTSRMFMGGMRADQAGITRMRLYHPTAKTSNTDISCRFIAVGRVDGEHAAAAAVISEAIPFVNEESYGAYSTLNEYFYAMYETYIGSTGRNGWCSEFWSVCTYLAGFKDDSVCPKGAGAYIIAGKISDKGNFYIRQGSGTSSKFVHATMTAGKTYADKTNFAYTIDGTTEYIPQIGDVLFCQGVKNGYYYPHHTAIVVSTDINDEGYFINTVEGNLSNNDEEYTGTSVRRRARNMYSTTQTTGLNILAVGHIDYPTSYNYADKTADGTSSSGGSGTATGVASIADARRFLGLGE